MHKKKRNLIKSKNEKALLSVPVLIKIASRNVIKNLFQLHTEKEIYFFLPIMFDILQKKKNSLQSVVTEYQKYANFSQTFSKKFISRIHYKLTLDCKTFSHQTTY